MFLRRIWYGPPDWIVEHFPSHDRRAFGFWTFVFAVVGSIFFGRVVLYVTALSCVALIPNFTSETPVEAEDLDAAADDAEVATGRAAPAPTDTA